MKQELRVQRIKNGTVIDHVPAGAGLSVMRMLEITADYKNTVSLTMNVPSKVHARKDVVKFEGRALHQEETNKLSLLAPEATVNIIKNYKVVRKRTVSLGNTVVSVLKCANSVCITNQQEPIETVFAVEQKHPMRLRCTFCERTLEKEEIERQF